MICPGRFILVESVVSDFVSTKEICYKEDLLIQQISNGKYQMYSGLHSNLHKTEVRTDCTDKKHSGAFCSLGVHFLASLHKIPYIDLTFKILFFSVKLNQDDFNALFITKT